MKESPEIYGAVPQGALGIYTYDTLKLSTRALGLLQRALEIDPALHDANLFSGLIFIVREESR